MHYYASTRPRQINILVFFHMANASFGFYGIQYSNYIAIFHVHPNIYACF